ncbi:NAD(P)/FAD-dependent oxidoreductase [Ruminococcus sp. OA3]|uniref:FAD-dependent oxidoreductase n=1 Tax=Ruminococcus sp. OA3 TaxID=2914164 RepID=UPI001F06E157|nr:NAD(P)/FAD-dependent oxidoreductase [Ruminococcus sp. OA3]
MYDAVIIGAGVTGCAAARELSRYRLNICVLEKEEDICAGTSKANSGLVHAGFDAEPGTLKARMNVLGNRKIDALSGELDIPFRRNGAVVLCREGQDEAGLVRLMEQGHKNGVPDLRLLRGEELHRMIPAAADDVKAALLAPGAGIVCPFRMTAGLAENACTNGVEFWMDCPVKRIEKHEDGYCLDTGKGKVFTRCVINAAGVYADVFNNMVSEELLRITPRRGEYLLLDKRAGSFTQRTIFQMPGPMGKGVLITPTIHGNLLVGPTAQDTEDREAVCTTAEGLLKVQKKGMDGIRDLPLHETITSFAGLRAHEDGGDFVIGEAKGAPGFFNAAGIESPGLSAAPAIGCELAEMTATYLKARKNQEFTAVQKNIFSAAQASAEELSLKIRENPAYGNVICRCETVTEGEIIEAIRRKPGARSLDGVKRRTRAGMGRCQSGFCMPKVMEILCRELDLDPLKVTKAGGTSYLLNGYSGKAGGQ